MTKFHNRLQCHIRILGYTMVLILAGALNFAQAEKSLNTVLKGRILYHGPILPVETAVIEEDIETCGTIYKNIPVAVSDDGGLAQVIVSVEGLSGTPLRLKPDPFILRNEKCRFLPHIGIGSIKQPLEVQNSDAILHNTHIRTDTRAFFNVVLLPQSKGIMKIMKKPGLMTIACNKHPFMEGFIHVFDHPYHAITDTQGAFSIPNLPPGIYRLAIWHKTLGTINQTVTIPQKDNAVLNIEFTAR